MTILQALSMIGVAFLIAVPVWLVYLIGKVSIIYLVEQLRK